MADRRHWSAASVVRADPAASPELRAWARVLRPGDRVVDVGANVGLWTVHALDLGASVVAVEPDPLARAALARSLHVNGYRADVRPVALADRETDGVLTAGLDDTNRLALDEDLPGGRQPVRVTTLDALLAEALPAGPVGGVKVDTEGAELLVLRGAAATLASRRVRLWQLEWNFTSRRLVGSDRQPVADLLREADHVLLRPDADGRLHPCRPEMDDGPDVFAAPREALPTPPARDPTSPDDTRHAAAA